MKSYKNLYPQICDWENLYKAWRKARKGKRSREPAAHFESNLGETRFRPGQIENGSAADSRPRGARQTPWQSALWSGIALPPGTSAARNIGGDRFVQSAASR